MKKPSKKDAVKLRAAKLPWHRRWLAKIWLTYGGGLYAVGYGLTFLYLEVRSIIGELGEADGVIDFLTSQLIEFLFRFLSESISNMVQAFIWFIPVIEFRPPMGFIILGVGFLVFDIFLRKPIGDWLLRESSGGDE